VVVDDGLWLGLVGEDVLESEEGTEADVSHQDDADRPRLENPSQG